MHEFELKLQVPPGRAAAVRAALCRGAVAEHALADAYFDTPDAALQRHGVVLRIRRDGARWWQCAKAPGDGALLRLEHEVAIAAPRQGSQPVPDLTLHAGHAVGACIRQALSPRGMAESVVLVPRFATRVTRLSRQVRCGASVMELAFDNGVIECAGQSVPVCELEVELKRGQPAMALALAGRWRRRHGLWLSTLSKSQRGQRLAQGTAPERPRLARQPDFHRFASAPEMARAVLRECLAHVVVNASELSAGQAGTEIVHQLRVGIRRLLAALRELPDLYAGVDPAWSGGLKALFDVLGQGRDLDLAVHRVQPALQGEGGPPVDWKAPQDCAADLASLVRADRCQDALLGLLGWAGRDPAALPGPAAHAREVVGRRLTRLHARVLRDSLRFAQLDDPARHRLRKRIKRLRYLAELTARLYPGRRTEHFLARLRPVQDALGEWQDERAALRLFRAQSVADPRAWFGVGWLRARQPARLDACALALRELSRAKPFWA